MSTLLRRLHVVSQRDQATAAQGLGVCLLTTPLILFFPWTFAAVVKPTAIIDNFDFYGPFYLLPFAIAAFLFWRASQTTRDEQTKPETKSS